MLRKLAVLSTVLFCLLLPDYASATKIKSSWKDPDATAESFQFKKVVVVAIYKDNFTRKVAEDKAVQIIKSGGNADAVASYIVFGYEELKDKEQAKSTIEGQGFDAAILMRYTGADDTIKYNEDDHDAVTYPYNQFWGYYGWGWGAAYNATSNPDDLVIFVETRLYSLKEDKLIWSGVSETRIQKIPQS